MVPKLRNSVSIAAARSWFHIAYSVGSLGRDDEHVDVQPVVDEVGDERLRLRVGEHARHLRLDAVGRRQLAALPPP